ncbi:MAG: hypothetical protein JXB07_01280 [Anaerolineae bacterium]|nr:hypothetical protein [Anaerolineae bacterium]
MKLLRTVAVILTVYALIEIADCLAILLMHFGLIENLYPAMSFLEFDELLNQQPIMLFPVFLYFASLRLVSALGLFRQRMWAFWTTVLVCVTTILWVPFLMPITGFELLLDATILFLLLLARFGNQPILSAG